MTVRHFEYVGGGSEKFWEISQDGSSVTVRFGRIGTNGQTQMKELASAAAAQSHVAKLVAEKVKKGYVEDGITATPAPPPKAAPFAAPQGLPRKPSPVPAPASPESATTEADIEPVPAPAEPEVDEDTWTVPATWWRQTEPLRGRGPKRSTAADPAASAVAAELLALAQAKMAATIASPHSDRELAQRARLFLGTPATLLRKARREIDPLGAAVVGRVMAAGLEWRQRDRMPAVVDDWVSTHGIVFAAEAGALLAGVRVFDPSPPGNHNSESVLAVRRAEQHDVGLHHVQPMLTRLRALLAAAADPDYTLVVERLARLREAGTAGLRVTTSYLVPTEQGWLDDDIARIHSGASALAPLLASATTEAQATAVLDRCSLWTLAHEPRLGYSMAAHIGPEVAPVLARVFDGVADADARKRIVAMLGLLPTDEALDLLLSRLDQKYVAPAVLEAMARFPLRAMRLLAGAAAGDGATAAPARDLLHGHVISHPGLVAPARDALGGAAAELLDRLAVRAPAAPIAPPERLPAILVTPPWASAVARPKPVIVPGLGRPSPPALAWKPGEQADWAEAETAGWLRSTRQDAWPELVAGALAGRDWRQIPILAHAPVDLVRPYIHKATPRQAWDAGPSLRRLLGRLGDDALGFAVRAAVAQPTSLAGALLPVEGSEVANRMAEWYVRSKTIRPVALAWFDRHATTAARDLVPVALGKPGKDRVAAEVALRVLDQQGHRDAILAAARAHGTGAIGAVDAALAMDPLHILPARIPALPAWLDPAHLSPVLLREGDAALPGPAVAHFCTMLAISKPGDTYAGVDVVRQAVDPVSLAEMAWSMFERWRGAGYPSSDGWVLEALGLIGDDETVRRLAPLIRAWPGESAHARAVAGLDVLAAIGSDVALMHLHGIAQKAKFKGLKTKAQAKMDEVADGLGLTADQLADRLVPDFGLDADGSLLLDFGARVFRVGFDEALKPVVADEDGSRRKVLPKPNAKDDPALAPAAYALFSGLKKDVKTVAADQIRRFEQAMVAGRRWSASEHRMLFVEHPLLWHLVRRLVWGVFDDGGQPVGSFRVAEDRTLADSTDDELSLDDDALVGIAHPLHLGDTLGKWSDLFADYEILQPFPQLGREVFRLTDAERKATLLHRFKGITVPTGKILGLSHRGWERGMAQDAGMQGVTYKSVAGGCAVVIDLDPGIAAGEAMAFPEQAIDGVWLDQGVPDWGNPKGNLPFGALDPITASEALRDLESLRP